MFPLQSVDIVEFSGGRVDRQDGFRNGLGPRLLFT